VKTLKEGREIKKYNTWTLFHFPIAAKNLLMITLIARIKAAIKRIIIRIGMVDMPRFSPIQWKISHMRVKRRGETARIRIIGAGSRTT
jgi:hypothetical protein